MDKNKKSNQQIEINDLLAVAIVNAVTRRGLVETQETLLGLCDDEAAEIMGGLTSATTLKEVKFIEPVYPPIIAGMIALPDDPKAIKSPIEIICEPTIVGLIALPDDQIIA